jgi:N-acetylmuramoyl-L-alanine amidase
MDRRAFVNKANMTAMMDFFSTASVSAPRSQWSPKSISVAATRRALLLPILVIFFQFSPPPPLAFADCASKAKEDIIIVLDVGHTAADPGALSARGVPEYDFNVSLGRRINAELLQAGFASTYLMVTNASRLSLRPGRANAMNADLFLSLHHDSVPDEYLRTWHYGGAEHQFSDDFSGFSLFVSGENGNYRGSVNFARALAGQLMSSGLEPRSDYAEYSPPGRPFIALDSARGIYRFDDFVVLRETEMPAVLFESGVIVNPEEELTLASPSHQATVARAVTQAIGTFCRPREATTYRVTGVAAEDVLNIRSGPAADRERVGSIPPNGRAVRIVGACRENWCPIEYGGVRGWVNRGYLTSE